MSSSRTNTLIAADEIKVWFVSPQVFSHSSSYERFHGWLSPNELETYRKFRFEKDQHTYLIAHALLRAALSRCRAIEPSRWMFRTNAYQKPFVLEPSDTCDLHFNLSHTDGMVAVAITRAGQVGIDVETLSQDQIGIEIVQEVLSEDEYHDYLLQQPPDQHKRLLQYWTLKEAFVKATGLGITAGLKNHAFDLSGHPHPKIRFLSTSDFSSSDWRFWQYNLTTGHFLAVACQQDASREITPSLEEALWLQEF